ncbi:hypothetical protein [Streptococcus thoraltensis]
MTTLEERLKAIELKENQIAMIQKETRWQQLIDGGSALASLATGGVSDIFLPLLDINKEIEQGIRETKQSILLELYLNKFDDMASSFEELKEMIGDTYGNHLFNRLLWLLDSFPPEDIYISLISNILARLVDEGNYKKLFGKHQLHLRMIERMSPQALYLLSHYEELVPFTKEHAHSTTLNAETGQMELQGDWSDDLVKYNALDHIIAPVVSELIDSHYIVAERSKEESIFIPTLTKSGRLLFHYTNTK